MPQNKKQVIQNRRKEVAELYLKGWLQAEIAQKFNVSQQQICYDLKVIYRLWRQSSIKDFDQLKERELLKVNKLERTYWEAWAYSLERKKTEEQSSSNYKEITEDSHGDPRYLQGVQWCINKRCEILGLNAPVKHEEMPSTITVKVPDEIKNR